MRQTQNKAIANQAERFGLTYVRKGGRVQVRLPGYRRANGALVWDSESGSRETAHPDAERFLQKMGER